MFVFLSFSFSFSQKIELKLCSKDSTEKNILKKINFKKQHKNKASIYTELDFICEQIKKNGFFNNKIDTIIKKEFGYCTYFNLGAKVETVTITIKNKYFYLISNYNINNNKVEIKPSEVPEFLSSISEKLEEKGNSFSEVKLSNIVSEGRGVFADLSILLSKKRTIDKVIVKGYKEISKNYLRLFLNVQGKTFNKKRILEISKNIKSIPFVSEVQPAKVLFKKDSTYLYVYLKKEKTGSFEGVLNFSSENETLFTGNINLKLSNILNSGERFGIYWNSENKNSFFKASFKKQLMFGLKLNSELDFSILKNDSTSLNTSFTGKLLYFANPKTEIGISFTSESSNLTSKSVSNTSFSYKKNLYGIYYSYQLPKVDFLDFGKFGITVNPSFGARLYKNGRKNQLKIELKSHYIKKIAFEKYFLFLVNYTELFSKNYLDNEFFQTSFLSATNQLPFDRTNRFFNFELNYLYIISKKSSIFPVVESFLVNKLNDDFSFIGIGYNFKTKQTRLKIKIVTNVKNKQGFGFRRPVISISNRFVF